MDAWTHGRMDAWTHGRMHAWTHGIWCAPLLYSSTTPWNMRAVLNKSTHLLPSVVGRRYASSSWHSKNFQSTAGLLGINELTGIQGWSGYAQSSAAQALSIVDEIIQHGEQMDPSILLRKIDQVSFIQLLHSFPQSKLKHENT